jgi:hypothetical protein
MNTRSMNFSVISAVRTLLWGGVPLAGGVQLALSLVVLVGTESV